MRRRRPTGQERTSARRASQGPSADTCRLGARSGAQRAWVGTRLGRPPCSTSATTSSRSRRLPRVDPRHPRRGRDLRPELANRTELGPARRDRAAERAARGGGRPVAGAGRGRAVRRLRVPARSCTTVWSASRSCSSSSARSTGRCRTPSAGRDGRGRSGPRCARSRCRSWPTRSTPSSRAVPRSPATAARIMSPTSAATRPRARRRRRDAALGRARDDARRGAPRACGRPTPWSSCVPSLRPATRGVSCRACTRASAPGCPSSASRSRRPSRARSRVFRRARPLERGRGRHRARARGARRAPRRRRTRATTACRRTARARPGDHAGRAARPRRVPRGERLTILVAARDEEARIEGDGAPRCGERFPEAEVPRRGRRLARRDRRRRRGGGRIVLRLPRRGKGEALSPASARRRRAGSSSATPTSTATSAAPARRRRGSTIAGLRPPQRGGFGIVKRVGRPAVGGCRSGYVRGEPLSGQRLLTLRTRGVPSRSRPGFGCETRMTIDAARAARVARAVARARAPADGARPARLPPPRPPAARHPARVGPLAVNHRGLRLPLVGWLFALSRPGQSPVAASGSPTTSGAVRARLPRAPALRPHHRRAEAARDPAIGLVATRRVSGALLVGLAANALNQLDTRPGPGAQGLPRARAAPAGAPWPGSPSCSFPTIFGRGRCWGTPDRTRSARC